MFNTPIYRLSLVREATYKSEYRVLSSPLDAYQFIRGILENCDREEFLVVMLDCRNRVIGVNRISIGSINASIAHPREVFKAAILSNASTIMLSHNHPSGDPSPSAEDLALTTRLKQGAELLGIPIIDHVIVGDERYISLSERGLL